MTITAIVKKWRDSQKKESPKNATDNAPSKDSKAKAYQMSANYEQELTALKKRIPEFIEKLEVKPNISIPIVAPVSQNYKKSEQRNTYKGERKEESPLYPDILEEDEKKFTFFDESDEFEFIQEDDEIKTEVEEETSLEEDDWDKEMKEFTQGLFEECKEVTEKLPMAKSKAKRTQRTFANKQETIEKKQEDKQEKTEEKQESKGLILSTDNLASASWEEENGNFNLENLLKSMSNREKIDGKYSEEKESIFRKKHRKNDKKHLKDRDNLRERDKEKEKIRNTPRTDEKPTGDNRKKRYRWV